MKSFLSPAHTLHTFAVLETGRKLSTSERWFLDLKNSAVLIDSLTDASLPPEGAGVSLRMFLFFPLQVLQTYH